MKRLVGSILQPAGVQSVFLSLPAGTALYLTREGEKPSLPLSMPEVHGN